MSDAPDVARRARMRLVYHRPWWGALALKLRLKADASVPFAAVDGTTLRWNPQWFADLLREEREAVIAHEVEHCALGHVWRVGKRDRALANVAADHVVNLDLKEAGFKLPQPHHADPRFLGMSFEQVYAALEREQTTSSGGGSGSDSPPEPPDPSNFGDMDPPQSNASEQSVEEVRQEWSVATEIATATAARAGSLPGSLKRTVERSRARLPDVRSVLQRCLRVSSTYSYARPHRRFIHRGLYLPGPVKQQQMGEIVIFVDTSGSIPDKLLGVFQSAVGDCLALRESPSVVHVGYCDAMVHRLDTYRNGAPLEFRPVGGGGTRFQPAFDAVAKRGIQPDVLVYLTDLQNGYEALRPPSYPVLWVVPRDTVRKQPFGEIAYIDGFS